jgi:hypothetical protein
MGGRTLSRNIVPVSLSIPELQGMALRRPGMEFGQATQPDIETPSRNSLNRKDRI